MSGVILGIAIGYAQIALGLTLCLVSWRAITGPRAQDRVLGLDALYVSGMLFLLVSGMRYGTVFFFEAALVIGVLGFVSTVALAKFLLRGEVIE